MLAFYCSGVNMTSSISQVLLQAGNTFQPDGRGSNAFSPGDEKTYSVSFPNAFPQYRGPQVADSRVVVILTPNDSGSSTGNNPHVVGLVCDADNSKGFTIKAYNPDNVSGIASFNWLAVLEISSPPPTNYKVPPASKYDFRAGVVQPLYFGKRGDSDSDNSWAINTYDPFSQPPLYFLSENNLNHFESYYYDTVYSEPNLNAVIGNVRQPHTNRFIIHGHSSDVKNGTCAFNYIGVAKITEGALPITAYMDTGILDPTWLGGDEKDGDWVEWNNIYFKEPFLTPPTVLVTPYFNSQTMGFEAYPVGIVRNVTTHGFTLAARNSFTKRGEAGFYWLALGSSKFGIGTTLTPI
jgi:hypothetical protein